MKKFALALGIGMMLSWAAPLAHADSIQTLATPNLSAATFTSLFQPIATAPAMTSNFTYLGSSPNASGVMESQVFAGTGAAAGYYAYAYQLGVNNTTDSAGSPVDVQSASWKFNSTPSATDFTNLGHNVYAYSITDGPVGGLSLPKAAPGQSILSPATLNWEPTTTGGSVVASFVNSATGVPALEAGGNSATFVIITQSPFTQQFVNIQSPDPVDPNSLTTVYSPTTNLLLPPIPEPATLLAWAGGIAGAALLHRRRRLQSVKD